MPFDVLGTSGGSTFFRLFNTQSSNFGYWTRGLYRTHYTVPEDRRADYALRDYISPLSTAYWMELCSRVLDRYMNNPLYSDALGLVPRSVGYVSQQEGSVAFAKAIGLEAQTLVPGQAPVVESPIQKFYRTLADRYQGKVQFRMDPEHVAKIQSIDDRFLEGEDVLRKALNQSVVRGYSDSVGVANIEEEIRIAGQSKEYQYLTHYLKSRLNFNAYLADLQKFGVLTAHEVEVFKQAANHERLEKVAKPVLEVMESRFERLAFNLSHLPVLSKVTGGDKGLAALESARHDAAAVEKVLSIFQRLQSTEGVKSKLTPQAFVEQWSERLKAMAKAQEAKTFDLGKTLLNLTPKFLRGTITVENNVAQWLGEMAQEFGIQNAQEMEALQRTVAMLLKAKTPAELSQMPANKALQETLTNLLKEAKDGTLQQLMGDLLNNVRQMESQIGKAAQVQGDTAVQLLSKAFKEQLNKVRVGMFDDILPSLAQEQAGVLKEKLGTFVPIWLDHLNTRNYLSKIRSSAFWPKSLLTTAVFFVISGWLMNKFDYHVVQPWQKDVAKRKGDSKMVELPIYTSIVPAAVAGVGSNMLLARFMPKLSYMSRFALSGAVGLTAMLAAAVAGSLAAVAAAPDVDEKGKKPAPKAPGYLPPKYPASAPLHHFGQAPITQYGSGQPSLLFPERNGMGAPFAANAYPRFSAQTNGLPQVQAQGDIFSRFQQVRPEGEGQPR